MRSEKVKSLELPKYSKKRLLKSLKDIQNKKGRYVSGESINTWISSLLKGEPTLPPKANIILK